MQREGKLESHNYGRGHCSGEHFRPAGTPLSPSEQKALATPKEEKRRQRWIHHFAREDGKALCGADDRKRSPWGFRDRVYRPKPVTDPTKVTCKRCQAALAKAPAMEASQKDQGAVAAG